MYKLGIAAGLGVAGVGDMYSSLFAGCINAILYLVYMQYVYYFISCICKLIRLFKNHIIINLIMYFLYAFVCLI